MKIGKPISYMNDYMRDPFKTKILKMGNGEQYKYSYLYSQDMEDEVLVSIQHYFYSDDLRDGVEELITKGLEYEARRICRSI